MDLPAFLRPIIDWVRAGYPEGVPEVDPKDVEIARVRARLAAGGWPLAPLDRQAPTRGALGPRE